MKLTKAQMELLAQLPTSCVEYYRPAQKLIELGLACRQDGYSSRLDITDAGRSALTEKGE